MDSYEQAYDASVASGGQPAAASLDAEPALAGPAAVRQAGPVKRTIFKYLQPAILLAILAFWTLAPASVTHNGWVGALAGTGIMVFIMALEWVNERHAHWRLTVREFLEGAFYIVANRYLFGAVSAVLLYDPLKAFVMSYGLTTGVTTGFPLSVQVLMLISMHEFVQYWFHRMLHNHPWLWEVHVPHHYITQLNTMNAAVGNWLEIMFLGLTLGIFFEMPREALLCAGNIGGAVAYFAHSNIRFDPPRWYSFFFTTIEHHSLHHSLNYDDTRYNYANELIIYDRIFGTFREGEAIHVGQDEQRRLSIWEQSIWPFLPAKMKAKKA
ncbi:MAG: sterol desaturase family protein [Candidatus Andeanibacterium colombiense]|uniref:Sterol desaturase family protein n=1 Tax=Candidatus Andeanibacterium colombiense TaxID=3121345 RepID=A0AAJ6BNL8_9SPHN|nr:MAG: sterol desaturase family protein [Sphingomonadaceae bacterium]